MHMVANIIYRILCATATFNVLSVVEFNQSCGPPGSRDSTLLALNNLQAATGQGLRMRTMHAYEEEAAQSIENCVGICI